MYNDEKAFEKLNEDKNRRKLYPNSKYEVIDTDIVMKPSTSTTNNLYGPRNNVAASKEYD